MAGRGSLRARRRSSTVIGTGSFACGTRLGRSDWSGRNAISADCVMQGAASPVLLAPVLLRARMLSGLMQSNSGYAGCRATGGDTPRHHRRGGCSGRGRILRRQANPPPLHPQMLTWPTSAWRSGNGMVGRQPHHDRARSR
eukprot:6726364-Prymnesium_polylepis.1